MPLNAAEHLSRRNFLTKLVYARLGVAEVLAEKADMSGGGERKVATLYGLLYLPTRYDEACGTVAKRYKVFTFRRVAVGLFCCGPAIDSPGLSQQQVARAD
jgi:hypothetical protein